MLPTGFIAVAILLRLGSGASYLRATWQGRAQPSIISWSFWSLTAMVAFAVQLIRGGGPEVFVTLAIGVSPVAVCAIAIYKNAYHASFTKTDKICIALTVIGILLWLISKNPLTALFMSILADIFSSVPTIIKSYQSPETEHPTAYALSIISMSVTLLTITNWHVTNWLFTAYILCINVTYVSTITIFSKMRKVPRQELAIL
ncbi:MAG: hypothetical protein ACQR33_00460 [Candidatus Saccharibacteria bacterium]